MSEYAARRPEDIYTGEIQISKDDDTLFSLVEANESEIQPAVPPRGEVAPRENVSDRSLGEEERRVDQGVATWFGAHVLQTGLMAVPTGESQERSSGGEKKRQKRRSRRGREPRYDSDSAYDEHWNPEKTTPTSTDPEMAEEIKKLHEAARARALALRIERADKDPRDPTTMLDVVARFKAQEEKRQRRS